MSAIIISLISIGVMVAGVVSHLRLKRRQMKEEQDRAARLLGPPETTGHPDPDWYKPHRK